MDGPAYVRLGRAAVPVFYDETADVELGKGNVLRKGKDVTVMVQQALWFPKLWKRHLSWKQRGLM